jgi:linoleoyl-CoA desaturase
MGFIKSDQEYRKELISLIGWKLVYYLYTLVIPVIMLPFAPWMVILAFVVMHLVIGLSITVVFQTAHVMPDTAFPSPDENGLIGRDWAIHQLATTTNYAMNSRVFSWLIGGLNFQIEHHLCPDICHVHYRKISGIVADTAREFGLAYHTKKTFIGALWAHMKMLRQLGSS